MNIPLMKNSFYDEDKVRKELSEFVMSSKIFSMGDMVKRFELKFAEFQKRKYAVMVNSGSSANLILLQSLINRGILKIGDRVGVSALTWATNVMPIIQLGLIPVALDCEIKTLNVSPAILIEKIHNLQALFITNVLGFADDLPQIRAICEREKVLLLEDNCESLGSSIRGVLLGNYSYASTFSFFIGHHLSTIEGGMVCTDDEELYTALLMARSHGWDRQLPLHAQARLREAYAVDDFFAKYTFYELGYNLRPTEINGFLGLFQIEYLPEMIRKREENYFSLQEVISKNLHFNSISVEHMDTVSNFAVPVICNSLDSFTWYRKKFMDASVEIRPVISGDITRQPFFKKYMNDEELKNATKVHRMGFYFTNRPDLIEDEILALKELLS